MGSGGRVAAAARPIHLSNCYCSFDRTGRIHRQPPRWIHIQIKYLRSRAGPAHGVDAVTGSMLQLTQSFLPFSGALDPAAAYQGTYQLGLVVLSLGIASLSAFVALSVSGRVVVAGALRSRVAWVLAG